MAASIEPLSDRAQAVTLVPERQCSSANPPPKWDDNHGFIMHPEGVCTPESQCCSEGEKMFRSDSMLPDTQDGDGVQLQCAAKSAGGDEVPPVNTTSSLSSQLLDTHCQATSAHKDISVGFEPDISIAALQGSDDPSRNFQPLRVCSQNDRGILKSGTSESMPDVSLSEGAHYIKAHFQGSPRV